MITQGRKRRPLRGYQKRGFYWSSGIEHPAIFWEPRLGKTVLPIRRMKADQISGPVLVVGPYSCLSNWRRELNLEGVPDSEIAFLTGDRAEREAALQSPAMFKIINKEGFRVLPEIASVRWEEMVVDESTFLKGLPRMNWTEKYGKRPSVSKFFMDHFRDVRRRWILTGTPSPESELDLFHQLAFLDPEILPFDTIYHFRHSLFVKDVHDEWIITDEGRERLSKRLATACSYLSRKDVHLDVPVIRSRRMVRLSPKARKMYSTAKNELILEHAGSVWDVADFGIEAYSWLRQICGGFFKERDTVEFHHKANELTELMKGELANDPVVVWCSFTAELLKLSKLLDKRAITNRVVYGDTPQRVRETRFDDFRRGNYQVLLCQPAVAQHSQDFSHCDTMVYYSTPTGLEMRLQSQDRFINVAEGGSKYIIDLVTEGTIEEDIVLSLYLKESRQAMLKRIVNRIHGKDSP